MLQSLSRKDHLLSHAITYEYTIQPGIFFWNIVFLVLARVPFKRWKISSLFSMSSCLSSLCSSSLQARRQLGMSRCHTLSWCVVVVGARKRSYFVTFTFIFARFGRFACFGNFGGFVSFVSVVSVVSVVSFRPFRFVVSGFSTCQCSPLPYLWPKSAIFPTLFMTWPKIRNPI